MENEDRVQIVLDTDTGDHAILVDNVTVHTCILGAGEDRRVYNRRVDEIGNAVRATVARLEKEDAGTD